MLSGPSWCSQFPTSTSVSDLADPFRTSCQRFLDALHAAGATVTISATLRRPERAYLMHWAWAIAREGLDPRAVPKMAGVDIKWTHPDNTGDYDPDVIAAEAMVQAYGIVFKPALTSRHIEGKAIDMDISWIGILQIDQGSPAYADPMYIGQPPLTGANTLLHQVGASYGVYKLVSDPPHWSADGH